MANKPFANSAQHNSDLLSTYLIEIQAGNLTDDNGLPQMKYITVAQLQAFLSSTSASAWTFRGEYSSALPDSPAVNDYFYASATFTVSGTTYTSGHLYAYNVENEWVDITNILSQYAFASDVQGIDDRLTVAEKQITAFSGGIIPMGDIASANLPTASLSNKGYWYYLTDLGYSVVSNGIEWIQFSVYVVQNSSTSDTSHALSNAATTTMINAEATARQNADASLTNADSQLNKRVLNLEQKAGDYTEIDYPDDTYGYGEVPSGKADYAEVKTMKGVTRGWNQMVENGNFDAQGTWTDYKRVSTISVNNNAITATCNNANNLVGFGKPLKAPANHIYFCAIKLDSFTSGIAPQGGLRAEEKPLGLGMNYIRLAPSSNSTEIGVVSSVAISGATITCSLFMLYDLTLLFGSGNEPSTVAEALQRIPQLAQYNAYNAGELVSTVYSGVTSVGKNVLNGELENGTIDATTGQNVPRADRWRTKNYSRVQGGQTYTFSINGVANTINIVQYAYDYSFITAITGNTVTFDDRCCYIRLFSDSRIVDAELQLESGSTVTTYHPYFTTTLSLPSSVTLRSAGSVHDTLDIETGVVTRNVGIITLDGSDDESYGGYNSSYGGFSLIISDMNCDSYPNTQVSCDRFVPNTTRGATSNVGSSYVIKTYSSSDVSTILFLCGAGATTIEDLRTWLGNNNTTITYALATPTTESIGTTVDNFIETEGGGTVAPVQTQTNKIDSAFTMGYLTV